MFGNLRIIAFTVGCHFLLASTLFAAKPPLNSAQLIEESDLVIVAQIINLEIGTERSHVERGFGNYDWAIDLTLKMTEVEKGLFEQSDTIVVRCFRIKSRKSMLECLSLSGNHPILPVGTSVRAHLYKNDRLWRVVLPNGLLSLSYLPNLPSRNMLYATHRNPLVPLPVLLCAPHLAPSLFAIRNAPW